MRKFYKRIIFTKTPLNKSFRYRDKFQIYPLISNNAPKSPYNKHFPIFLEYYIDFDDNKNPKDIDIFDDLTAQQVVEYEIINILSTLTNHRFFKYNADRNQWAIMTPNCGFENLDESQRELFNNQHSSWTICGFLYPGLRAELNIDKFSDIDIPCVEYISPYYEYFLNNPVENPKGEISFPETIIPCLDNYYALSSSTQKKIKSTIFLICDGLDISDYKRSLSFLSYVSAIEALTNIEFSDKDVEFECNNCKSISSSPYNCPECGRPIWGIKAKFKNFLAKFVAGADESISKYNKIYNLRCKIAHTGQLLIGDYEFGLENYREKKDNEWLMKLETLQLTRLSLTNWLRYPEKARR